MLRITAAFLLVAIAGCSDDKAPAPAPAQTRQPAPVAVPAPPRAQPALQPPPPTTPGEASARALVESMRTELDVPDDIAERMVAEVAKITAGFSAATTACIAGAAPEEAGACLDSLDDATRMDVKNAFQQVIVELLQEAWKDHPPEAVAKPWVPVGAR